MKLLCIYEAIGVIWLLISWVIMYLVLGLFEKSGFKRKYFWQMIGYKLFVWPYDMYCGFKTLYELKHEGADEEDILMFNKMVYDEITEE